MIIKRRVAIEIGLVVGTIMVALAFLYWLIFWPEHKLQRNAQSLIGGTEAAVIARMGTPNKVITTSDVAARPKELWWGSGWHPAPTFPVTNKVFLYYGSFTGALIYVGPSGAVEHVHLIGT
jgi:hypothetical protein